MVFPNVLAGKTVLDLSLLLPGPYATSILAQFGARVIKVEPPSGDPARKINPQLFAQLNRGKDSVVLDLKTEADRDALLALARSADGLIEGFRPGVMNRLGVGYEQLKAENNALVYCALSGFGQTGPYKDRPGHDINFLGLSGYFSIPSQLDGAMTRPNVRVADLVAGQNAAMTMAMAMVHAEKTGVGAFLDCAISDSMAAWSLQLMLAVGDGPSDPASYPHVMADSDIFHTKDGKALTIGTLEDKFWVNLVAVLSEFEPRLADSAYATRRGRDADKHALHGLLSGCFAQKTRAEWVALLGAADTAWGPVYQGREMLEDPHFQAREMLVTTEDGGHIGAFPVMVSGERQALRGEVPALGAHTDKILQRG